MSPAPMNRYLLPLDFREIALVLLMLLERRLKVIFAQARLALEISVDQKGTYRQKIFLAIFWFSRSIRSSSALRVEKCNDFALNSGMIEC
jgi:hypothetical protein